MAHIQLNFYSQTLLKNTDVMVFLPTQDADDYLFGDGNAKYKKEKNYQVLYLLHGSYGDYTDWTRLANVERYAQQHCLAVVMPSAENSAYLNMDAGEAYLDYIGKELPEFLQIMFSISDKPEDNFIAGLSMGGYGSMRIGLEYPEKYAAIASLSGALDMQGLKDYGGAHMEKMDQHYTAAVYGDKSLKESHNDLIEILREKIKSGVKLPKLFMTVGLEDFIYPFNETFYDKVKEDVEIKYTKHEGVHDWNFWDTYIQEVMDWLPITNGKV